MDPDAKDLTLNYPGGSLTMPLGALKDLLGDTFEGLTPVPETKSVSVKSHSRTRVIGQPSTSVSGFSYEFTQWPTSQANNAAAGEVVLLTWDGSDGSWTGRVSGSLSARQTNLSTRNICLHCMLDHSQLAQLQQCGSLYQSLQAHYH